jgi:hypothetical protein
MQSKIYLGKTVRAHSKKVGNIDNLLFVLTVNYSLKKYSF